MVLSQAVLRPMRGEDLDWVCACEAELHAFPWTRGNFNDSLAAGHELWVWETENGPDAARLGYAVVQRVADEAELLDIGVAHHAQRRGVGRALLARLIDHAREHGATQFFLEVRPSNVAALALYRSAGFETVGRRRGYYPAAQGREDALVMRLAL
ncbi:ribosomal protein S18-alanine N-acetyltransferase [Thauera aromatica]|nr:ribosomal protein S18-alanine N-acetyltransferase [Thauera aromatica]MCK2127035.1 ribosomal protein S18-alanine N-acetyltransferase [Thauera aromatica]